MKIQGTFLASRAGRRIFWTLLLAAAAPIALFGVAMHTMLSAQFESQTIRQQVQLTKFAGMGVLDRLLVARTALDIVARTGRVDADAKGDSRSGRVLLEVAQLDSQGNTLAGSSALARRWRDRVSARQAQRDSDAATLLLGAEQPLMGARPVLLVLPDEKRRDHVWIAEADPAFLFGELPTDTSGARICVFDAPGRPVFCPGWTADSEQALRPGARDDGAADTHWSLFLRSDFGIDDWTLVSMEAPASGTPGAAPLAQMSALVAVATLLFVGLLGLIQVRRTMVPLERLIAGTRRLSEHDYSARVALRPGDEFGELAGSFNHMAERIGHQMQALRVQSSIDHEILNGLNVARVLQRVAQRLEQVLPGATVCIVEFDRTSRLLARAHSADTPMSIVGTPPSVALWLAQLPADETVLCDEPPPWLLGLMRRPSRGLWMRCAKAGNEVLGLLVIGTDGRSLDDDTRREIVELCDRVSVTLSSADRERRLVERATHDSLTGLANRAGLYESLEGRLAEDPPTPFSVLFVDLDRFKEVNDSLGHEVGDELLRAVARRLQHCVPAGTLVA
ncbi:MAG TPA: diguanylate cyclase, partial [Burkholderiaceae bacterium]